MAMSGCTSQSIVPATKEVNVGTLNVTNGINAPEFYMLKLPNNTSKVRAVYNLNASNVYGTAPNGNLGTANNVQKGEMILGMMIKW